MIDERDNLKLEDLINTLQKGDIIELQLSHKNSFRKCRSGPYLGRTKNRLWILSGYLGLASFELMLPMSYRIDKIEKITLFEQ